MISFPSHSLFEVIYKHSIPTAQYSDVPLEHPTFENLNFSRHSHGGTGCGSAHKPFSGLSCFLLQLLKLRIHRRILPIPPTPAPALFDELLIDVGAIGQKRIGNGAPVIVIAESLTA